MRVVGMSGPHDAGAGYVAVLLLCSVLGLVGEGRRVLPRSQLVQGRSWLVRIEVSQDS
jgi:hypothetical protein